MIQESCLPAARFTLHNDDAAVAGPSPQNEIIENVQFGISS
jgi:hypothetical protein